MLPIYMNIGMPPLETRPEKASSQIRSINHGAYAALTAFTVDLPRYDEIPNNLPIKDPYPLPSPAPPPPTDVPYARPIPPEVNERIANRLRDQTSLRTPVEPGPSKESMTPSSSPSSNVSSQVGQFLLWLTSHMSFWPTFHIRTASHHMFALATWIQHSRKGWNRQLPAILPKNSQKGIHTMTMMTPMRSWPLLSKRRRQ